MRIPVWIFLLLFTVSGFAGLIYESIWSHYLKLFLGHAAYAQTLVLGIFMGGMALGSWLAGKYAARIKQALLGYAAVELAIGLLALSFHQVFGSLTGWAFDTLMPMLGSPLLAEISKWLLATLLIFPASILLGATFPLMSSGIMRVYGDYEGKCLPLLYFTNSLGAAIGVLASGFILIERFGLPGTIFTAGLLNISLALVVWALTKNVFEAEIPIATLRNETSSKASHRQIIRLIYLAAFVTGAASFMFEVAWIRMLSMAIGASTHSFEVMLSAFILGIALGSLALSVFGHRIRNNQRALANVLAVKCLLALLAVATYPLLLDLFQWLYLGLSKTANGYSLYLLGSYGISGLMMIPTAICAGMTLPLATKALLEHGVGEKAIGQVYAANTLGAIAGTFLATHVGMELLGVKGITGTGAMLELLIAIGLLTAGMRRLTLLWPVLPGLLSLPAYAFALELDQLKMASGVFRFGEFLNHGTSKVRFYRDGKTATVSVVETKGYLEIRTNGKTDASVGIGEHSVPSPDEHTMALLAILPYLYAPHARTVVNIGFGSGLTTHVALGNPNLQRVDSVEIEAAMVTGARAFAPANSRAFEDARSVIHIEDAKTFLSSREEQFDVIVSEPSNPWISGVATLFSEEFYGRVAKKIKPQGVLVQWVQLYDTKPYIIASILKALGKHYADYVVYLAHNGDAIIVATPTGTLPSQLADPFEIPAWKSSLNRLGYASKNELGLLRLATRRTIEPLVQSFAIRGNSDYYPVIDLNAPRERFVATRPAMMEQLGHSFVPLFPLLQGEQLPSLQELDAGPREHRNAERYGEMLARAILARDVAKALGTQVVASLDALPPRVKDHVLQLRTGSKVCLPGQTAVWVAAYEELSKLMSGWLAKSDVLEALDAVTIGACVKALSEVEASRVRLVRAIVARHPQQIEVSSAAILNAAVTAAIDTDTVQTALLANLASKISLGKLSSARELIAQTGAQAVWTENLLWRAIAAHASTETLSTK